LFIIAIQNETRNNAYLSSFEEGNCTSIHTHVMENTDTFIKGIDLLLFFVYAVLGFYIMKALFFKKMDKGFNRVMLGFYIAKLAGCLTLSLLLVFYWKIGDNFKNYVDAATFSRFIANDITNIRYLFMPVHAYADKIQFDSSLVATGDINMESNFLMVRFCTFFYPFALGKYLLINFFFCLLSTITQLKLWMALGQRYPQLKRSLALPILFIPSVILYSSCILKETICMAFISMALYGWFHFLQKKHVYKNMLLIVISLFLLGIVKSYVLVSFAGAVLIFFLVKMFGVLFRGIIVSKMLGVLLLAGLLAGIILSISTFDSYVMEFANASNFFQEQYNNATNDESSAFEFGEVENSLSGIIKKAPIGVYTTYFRPQLWEVRKPIILFTALESFIILLFTLKLLFTKGKYFLSLMRKDAFVQIFFYYTMIFGVIVGLTTFNFGTLVRYRIPGICFFLVLLFILRQYKPADSKEGPGKLPVLFK
jgi:hypothetical protein